MRYQKCNGRSPSPILLIILCAIASASDARSAASETPGFSASATPANLLSSPPRTWIVDVAANEITAIKHPGSYLRYRMRTVDAKGDHVRDLIESRDGAVARLILKDGKPLTPEEDKAERDRLNDLIASPSDFARHIRNDQNGKKMAIDLIQLMPDAMIYTYAPGQPQLPLGRAARQVVIDYTPNPQWSPPSTTAEALTGLNGRMWVDSRSRHLLRMEGTVFRAVNVGWGMVAHVYPGGNVSLDQTTLAGNRLIFTRFVEQVAIRALMVKTLKVNATIEASAFQPLPAPVSYQDAIRMLLATPPPGS